MRLKRIFTGAEQLSTSVRRKVEQAAGCPIVDFLGACECNLVGWQCPECGLYHCCDDNVIVEVLRDGRPVGPGEDGELILTTLHSYAMPFLRYRLGDSIRLADAPRRCRVGFTTFERIQGRTVDYLTLPDGSRLSPYTLMDELDVLDGVQRYEAEQTDSSGVTVRVQPEEGVDRGVLHDKVSSQCRRVLPAAVAVRVEMVDRFVVDPTRKRRFVRVAEAMRGR